ncbi:MAG TPA: hypothetical protein VMV62_00220 [Candidatus Paceibacterota bacterium]|nr:hypothetical protein [Candidatus Paceibacterota bacterium]
MQEGIEQYKIALISFLEQHEKMMERAAEKKAGDLSLPSGFYDVERMGIRCEGMAEVLGLSKEEKVSIRKECEELIAV